MKQAPSHIITRLEEFVVAEREHLETSDSNIFGAAMRQVTRYREFLDVIRERHRKASSSFIALQKTQLAEAKERSPERKVMTKEEIQRMIESRELGVLVHLDVESFHVFAKNLLDRVANFLGFYFGQVQSVSFISHNKLRKGLQTFVSQKNVQLPAGFHSLMEECQKISDYRDDHIIHKANPRTIHATTFQLDGDDASIAPTKVYPTEKDTSQSVRTQPLGEAIETIDAYLEAFLELLSTNTHGSRFR